MNAPLLPRADGFPVPEGASVMKRHYGFDIRIRKGGTLQRFRCTRDGTVAFEDERPLKQHEIDGVLAWAETVP